MPIQGSDGARRGARLDERSRWHRCPEAPTGSADRARAAAIELRDRIYLRPLVQLGLNTTRVLPPRHQDAKASCLGVLVVRNYRHTSAAMYYSLSGNYV